MYLMATVVTPRSSNAEAQISNVTPDIPARYSQLFLPSCSELSIAMNAISHP